MAMSVKVTVSAIDKLTAPLKGMGKGLQGLEGNLRKASFEGATFNTRWAETLRLGQMSGAILAGMGVAILAVGAKSVKTASDVEESESKFDAVFKGLAASTREWSNESAKAWNRSQYDINGYLASLQDTFVPMGIARGEAAELSKSVAGLAVDLASFNNANEPEVVNLLTSALVGNHEAVRRFGISITQGRLDQELFTMGIEGGAKAAGVQEKMLARLNIIMGDTTDAQGDAARTAGSFANQMKGLSAALKDVETGIGKALIPLLKQLTPEVQSLGTSLSEVAETPLGATLIQLTVALGALLIPLGGILMVLPSLTAGWAVLAPAVTAAVAAMTGPVGLAVIAIAGLSAAIAALAHQARAGARAGEVLDEALGEGITRSEDSPEAMRKRLDDLVQAIRDKRPQVRDAGEELAEGLTEGLAGANLEHVKEDLRESIAALQAELAATQQSQGEEAEATLEAQKKLLEEQARLYGVLIQEAEASYDWWSGYNDAMLDQFYKMRGALQRTDDALARNANALAEVRRETEKAIPPVAELTKEQEASTKAAEDAADAERKLADARADGADAVEDARDRIEDAQEGIAEAHENAARRIGDAQISVREAYESLADAQAEAAEALMTAEERAASQVERAQERIADAKQRLEDFERPALTALERRARQRQKLTEDLREAEEGLAEARTRGEEGVEKAREQGVKRVEAANKAIIRAEQALVDVKRAATKSIEAAYERRADAVEALADAEEKALERIERAVKSLTKANHELAAAQAKVGGTGAAAPAQSQVGGVPMPAGAPPIGNYRVGGPQATYQGGWAAGPGRSAAPAPVHLYLHTDQGVVLDAARQGAADIIGSPAGRAATVRVIRDQRQRQ